MEYTLDDLVDAVAQRLAALGLDQQANGQVSAIPDRRTLRYYTTIGLLDRPAAVRDRQAIYHDRHVTQAVAVKRLQAEGWPLARIQARLTGLHTEALEAVADGPAAAASSASASTDVSALDTPTAAPAQPWSEPTRQEMGASQTAPASANPRAAEPGVGVAMSGRGAPPPTRGDGRFWAAAPIPAAPTAEVDGPRAQQILAIRLSDGVTLLLDGERAWAHSDVDGIRDAASTLLNYLRGDAAHTERNDDDSATPVAYPA
ncbi:MAG: MerR family transcriptional regulator [Acidimicrobiales bacterium]